MKYLALIFLLPTMACAGTHVMQGDVAGGDLTGTYPNPTLSSSYAKINPTSQQSGAINVSSGTLRTTNVGPGGLHLQNSGGTAAGGESTITNYGIFDAQVDLIGDGIIFHSDHISVDSSNFFNGQFVITDVFTDELKSFNLLGTANSWTAKQTFLQIQVSTLTVTGATFASLGGSAANGSFQYCSDCTVTTPATCTANALASCVCAGSGSGAFAKRLNSTWYCN